jgi:hypothetical protein
MRGALFISSILALLTVAVSWTQPARSANIFEQEFWMSGPRYSGKVPLCEQHEPLKSNRAPLQHQGGKVLEWI